jgi:hypothetical protein
MGSSAQGRRRWRAAVIALSLLGHLGLLGVMLASLPPREPLPEPPVIDVQMLPPPGERPSEPQGATEPVEAPTRPQTPASAPTVRPALPSSGAPSPVPGPAGRAPLAGAPAGGTAAPAGAAPAAGAVREVLRATVGCDTADLLGLTRREREACEEARGARARGYELPESLAERQARDARAVARNPRPKGNEWVRAPGDGPANHSVLGPPDGMMVGGSVAFGRPPKAIAPIPPSTLRGDDDALRPRPAPGGN